MEEKEPSLQKVQRATIIWLHSVFQRYYKGNATLREKEAIESWEPRPGKEEPLEKNIVAENCKKVWDVLAEKYQWGDKEEKEKKNTPSIAFRRSMGAAAVILLLIGLGNLLKTAVPHPVSPEATASSFVYFESADNKMKQITLPDSSVLTLNYNTKLSLDKDQFNRSKREIWLEEGEIFFEIAHNPGKPFIIHNGELQTTVRGTSFNIKAYKELGEMEVSVRNGKVEVCRENELLGTLTKNMQLTYLLNDKTFKTTTTNWADEASWRENRLVLNNANAKELKLRLKQHFNVDVILRGEEFNDMLFNASFRQGVSLDEVFAVIYKVYGVKYNIQKGNEIELTTK